jgi:hypothetical protein
LRNANWKQILTNDPQLTYDKKLTEDALKLYKVDYGPYVRAITSIGAKEVGGYASIAKESVLYGDISGDGKAEAIIPLSSAGTAGNVGALIYSPDPANKPVLVGVIDGNKLTLKISEGELIATTAIFAGYEPNCCPSSYTSKHFKLVAGQFDIALAEIKNINTPTPDSKIFAVEQFYKLLNAKKYKEAYDLFSPSMQARQDFETWKKGYADTKDIVITTKLSPTGLVYVTIRNKAGNAEQRFSGAWGLVWDEATTQWKLDVANLNVGDVDKDVVAPRATNIRVTANPVFYGTKCTAKQPTKLTISATLNDPGGVKGARIEYAFSKTSSQGGVAEAKTMQSLGNNSYSFTIDVATEGMAVIKTGTGTLKTVIVAEDQTGNIGAIDVPIVQVQPCGK